jgi:nitronate monooxygenase
MTLLETLGIDLPIIQAQMAGVSSPAMAAAVSSAGAMSTDCRSLSALVGGPGDVGFLQRGRTFLAADFHRLPADLHLDGFRFQRAIARGTGSLAH